MVVAVVGLDAWVGSTVKRVVLASATRLIRSHLNRASMKQSSFRYLGGFDLLLVAGFLAAFGVGALGTTPIALMALAGIAALLAGSLAKLFVGPITVPWRGFAAATYLLFAAMLPATYLPHIVAGTATTTETAMFAVSCVSALVFVFMGFDIARGGKHFEIRPNVERVVGR